MSAKICKQKAILSSFEQFFKIHAPEPSLLLGYLTYWLKIALYNAKCISRRQALIKIAIFQQISYVGNMKCYSVLPCAPGPKGLANYSPSHNSNLLRIVVLWRKHSIMPTVFEIAAVLTCFDTGSMLFMWSITAVLWSLILRLSSHG